VLFHKTKTVTRRNLSRKVAQTKFQKIALFDKRPTNHITMQAVYELLYM
jgi:hypothetical protein